MSAECEMCRECRDLPEILGRTRFDLALTCCRAQFLLRLPSKARRRAWLEKFGEQYGPCARDSTEKALVALWGRVYG